MRVPFIVFRMFFPFSLLCINATGLEASENPLIGKWSVLQGKCSSYMKFTKDRQQYYRTRLGLFPYIHGGNDIISEYRIELPYVTVTKVRNLMVYKEKVIETYKVINNNVVKKVYKKVIVWWEDGIGGKWGDINLDRHKNGEVLGLLEMDEDRIIRHWGKKPSYRPLVFGPLLIYYRC